MNRSLRGTFGLVFLIGGLFGQPCLRAQVSAPSSVPLHHPGAHYIVPHARPFTAAAQRGVNVQQVEAGIEVVEQVATTTLDIFLTNSSGSRLEAQILAPVPEGAVLRGFNFQGAANEPKVEILPKEEARQIYDSIVAKTRDPALLEF